MTCTCPMSVRETGRHSTGCPEYIAGVEFRSRPPTLEELRSSIGSEYACYEFPSMDAARKAWREVRDLLIHPDHGRLSSWSHCNLARTRYFVTVMGEDAERVKSASERLEERGGTLATDSLESKVVAVLRQRRWETALAAVASPDGTVYQEADYGSGATLNSDGSMRPVD